MVHWYMAVTNDKYELPLSFPMRRREIARYFGVSESAVDASARRNKGKRGKREELDKLEEMERKYGKTWEEFNKKHSSS